ncbi:MAG: NTP transferase domain-containing protein [Betaproteobacteria bacterium]|nr:NTP transferase domain-containing protein [Betaproteobacteria bacterium]
MHPFSDFYPKPGLPICNKPLIQYSIEVFRELGIREIFVVIGHLGHELAQALGNGAALGVKLRYIEQAKILGIASALGQLEPYVSSPMFVVLGDIFFQAGNLSSMVDRMDERKAGAVLAVKHETDPESIRRNFTVHEDQDGRVQRVIEKPRYVHSNVKGCGLYLFGLPVFDAIRRTPRTAMRDEYEITDTIQIMVDDGLPVFTADVVKWDVNLTAPADVLTCNLFELRRRGLDRLVGSGAVVHPGARLKNVVIGERATIEHPIAITDSVIFPDTVVTSEADFERFIVTPEVQIDCRAIALGKNH